MENLTFAVVALFILAFGAISGKISKTMITPPILFVAFGYLVGSGGLALVEVGAEHPLIHLIAEMTLVLVLFTDASQIDLVRLVKEHKIPLRLLAIGLPLTMVCGALAAIGVFPNLSIWEALVLAIILAPTDAALGQAVVSSELVPLKIRQALNVESGLNDGIALPILLFFTCLATAKTGGHEDQNWLLLATAQVTLGPLVGLMTGYLGGKLVLWGKRSQWMNESFQDLSSLGLALFAFAAAEVIGGNGYLAAFCAGLVLGNTAKGICHCLYEFAEAEGQLLTLITFLFFGAVMLPGALHHLSWQMVVYALLSLTVVRLLPVLLSQLGLGLPPSTLLFVGWFGPRGIASILYGLLVLEEIGLGNREELFTITVITVLFSVFLHGFSAWPGVKWLAAKSGQQAGSDH